VIVFEIPGALRPFAEGRNRVEIAEPCATVAAALTRLWDRHPGLRLRVTNEQGEIRRHVNVFVGSDNIRDIGGLSSRLPDGATITILAAVSGGGG
jgi:molybdopterin synthase sulfur carrier subunit